MQRAATALALSALVLAGCADGGEVVGPPPASPSPSPSPEPTAEPSPTSTTASPSPTPTGAEPPFTADTEPDTADGSGQQVVVTDIEVARHDGFDRVVLPIGGDGTPGWRVEYVDEAQAQGSGEQVEVAGEATLQVALDNMAYPTERDDAYEGPDRITPEDTEVIEEVVHGTTFEARTELWIGVTGELPFRAFLTEDGTRVVIDVVHPDHVGS